jgi:hypothetical protein
MRKLYMRVTFAGNVRLLYFTSYASMQSFVAALIRVFGNQETDNVAYIVSNEVLPGTVDEDYVFKA